MGNFGSNFLRGFQPNFANMFNDSYRNAFIQDERERQRKEEEKAKAEQLGILNQLYKGTKDVPAFQNNRVPLMNAGQSFGNQEVPLTKEEQFNLRARLSPSSALSFLDNQNKPQQQETVRVGNKYYKESSIFKGLPEGDPIWEEPQPKVTEDFVDASTVPGLEPYKDHRINRVTTENPDGTKTVKYTGSPFTWKKQNININTGEGYNDLSKESTAILNKYAKTIQDLQDSYEAIKKGGTVMKYDALGMPDGAWDLEGIKAELETQTNKYKAFIDRNMDVGTKEDWDSMISQVDLRDPKSLSSIWNTVHTTYTKSLDDEYDAAWYKEMQHKFISEFHIDPVQKFRK